MSRFNQLIVLTLAAFWGSSMAFALDLREAIHESYRLEGRLEYLHAIEVLSPYYRTRERDYFLNLRLGWLFRLQGNELNSKTHYEAAIRTEPSAIEPKLGLLYLYLNKKQWNDVERQGLEIIQNYPGQIDVVRSVVTAQMNQKKYLNALNLIHEQKKLFPIDYLLLKSEENCLLQLGRQLEAKKVSEETELLYVKQ